MQIIPGFAIEQIEKGCFLIKKKSFPNFFPFSLLISIALICR